MDVLSVGVLIGLLIFAPLIDPSMKKVYCSIDMSEAQYKAFTYAIKNHYWYQMYIGELRYSCILRLIIVVFICAWCVQMICLYGVSASLPVYTNCYIVVFIQFWCVVYVLVCASILSVLYVEILLLKTGYTAVYSVWLIKYSVAQPHLG